MDTELLIMVIQPTSRNDSNTIKSSNARLRKQSSKQISDDTANGVACKDIEGVVVTKYEFELGRKIATGSAHKPKKHSSGF